MGVVAVALIWTVGCAPEPAPTPTPTPAFASEEEAFAAAEEVYRAYNDALNATRAGELSAQPDQYLTGLALESDLEAERFADDHGLQIRGEGEVAEFIGDSADMREDDVTITARVCLDVSATRVENNEGVDVTPAGRANRLLLSIKLVGSPTLLISESTLIEGEVC